MFEFPKAAHFVAADASGRELPWNDSRGLAARWVAADHAGANGVDFRRLNESSRRALATACHVASATSGLTVRVADHVEQ